MSQSELTTDALVRLPCATVDHFAMFERPYNPDLLYLLPKLPPTVECIWIYENETQAITHVLVVDQNGIPIQPYFILIPCTHQTMLQEHGCHPKFKPMQAPLWLCQDYAELTQCIW